ncbi:hypothetical protein SAMN04515620_1116 [Collimonas sp. OK607]|uniref:major coat protein n=1 Tax=Collimonas sp. OK607 TaxID=1798194 RepID=UPI0008F0DCFC|nr:major coat protein [Collimonas sp. OK607]SFA98633.1 hypothetical protein SAMN04515620_1116 [Collimonas sp. OK607]
MFSKIKNVSQRAVVAASTAGVAVATALFSGAANATLDPAVATSLTAIQTDATSLNGLVMPIVLGIFGMLVTYKLIKRFGGKI